MRDSVPQGDCWREEGVFGTRRPRCERLQEVLHCFNCQVYTQASQGLFTRPLDSTAIEAATERLACPPPRTAAEGTHVLIFQVEDTCLALPTRDCIRVTAASAVRRVPHRSNDVLVGLVNEQGRLLPCVSLRSLLGLPEAPTGRDGRWVVVRHNRCPVVLQATRTSVTHSVRLAAVQRSPRTTAGRGGLVRGTFSWQERRVQLIDTQALAERIEEELG